MIEKQATEIMADEGYAPAVELPEASRYRHFISDRNAMFPFLKSDWEVGTVKRLVVVSATHNGLDSIKGSAKALLYSAQVGQILSDLPEDAMLASDRRRPDLGELFHVTFGSFVNPASPMMLWRGGELYVRGGMELFRNVFQDAVSAWFEPLSSVSGMLESARLPDHFGLGPRYPNPLLMRTVSCMGVINECRAQSQDLLDWYLGNGEMSKLDSEERVGVFRECLSRM